MKPAPRVSVIIPTYNRAEMLQRAVDSVVAQTFTDFELLIVDDCSADETPDVVAGLVNADARIRSFRHDHNRGLSATRNTGIGHAEGEYIAFLDDDDEFLPSKIESQVKALDCADADVGMVYVWLSHIGTNGELVGASSRILEGYAFDEALMLRFPACIGSTAMFRRSVFDAVGRFDETLLFAEDVDFFCRVAKHFRISVVPHFLTRYHVGHPSVSEPYNPSKRVFIQRRNYIKSHQTKFSIDIGKRRQVRSQLWRRLATAELRTGNHLGAFRAAFAVLLSDPVISYRASRLLFRWVVGRLGRLLRARRGKL